MTYHGTPCTLTPVTTTLPVMNTDSLVWLNANAIRAGRNRTLSEDIEQRADPEGIHVVWMTTLHKDGAEVRLFLMVKMAGTEDPATGLLDVTMAEYTNLPQAEFDADGHFVRLIPVGEDAR